MKIILTEEIKSIKLFSTNHGTEIWAQYFPVIEKAIHLLYAGQGHIHVTIYLKK